MWLFQHSSNCELWRHCWCWRRHPRCLHFSCCTSLVQTGGCRASGAGGVRVPRGASSREATGAPRPLTPSTPRSRRWRRRQSRRWRRRLLSPTQAASCCCLPRRASPYYCSLACTRRRHEGSHGLRPKATTIRVNTKSAEGAKAALLSSELCHRSATAPSTREGHCAWCRRAWWGLVVVPWVLAAASAFSQPFFCFEGQHPQDSRVLTISHPLVVPQCTAAAPPQWMVARQWQR